MRHPSILEDALLQVFICDPRSSELVDAENYARSMGLSSAAPADIGDEEDSMATSWQQLDGRKLTLQCREGIPPFLRGGVWSKLMAAGTTAAGTASHKLQLEAVWQRVKERVFPDGYMSRLPNFGAPTRFEDHAYLSEEGLLAAKRVLIATRHMIAADWCPALLDIAPMLLIFMPESCAYAVVEELWSERPLFFPATERETEVWSRTFVNLVQLFIPRVYKHAQVCGALTPKDLRCLFQRIFVGVLPLRSLVKVWDAWLCEGSKVIYRYGLALLKVLCGKLELLRPGDDWWAHIRDWTQDPSFCFDEVKKVAFSLRRKLFTSLTWSMLERLHSANAQKAASPSSSAMVSAKKNLGESEFRMTEEKTDESQPFFWPPFQISQVPEPTLLKSVPFRALLVDWVPELERHKTLRAVYSTEIFGFGIEILFSHCRSTSPSLTVVESTDGAIFGAFCSDPWQPSRTVYGNGQCFLFRLKPSATVFRWACKKGGGKKTGATGAALSNSKHGSAGRLKRENSVGSLAQLSRHGSLHSSKHRLAFLPHVSRHHASRHQAGESILDATARESFMMATRDFIAVGVSPTSGNCGLKLYNDLQQGSSLRCETFNNEPLVNTEMGHFEVSCVEVYAFVS